MLIVFGDDKGEVTCWNCDNRIASFKGEKSPVLTTEFSNLEEFTLAVGFVSHFILSHGVHVQMYEINILRFPRTAFSTKLKE